MTSIVLSEIGTSRIDPLGHIFGNVECVGSAVSYVSHHLYNNTGSLIVVDGNTPHVLLDLDEPCCLRITIERLDIEPDEFEQQAAVAVERLAGSPQST